MTDNDKVTAVVIRAYWPDKTVYFNPDYNGLPKAIKSELIKVFGALAADVKATVTLSVRNDGAALIGVFEASERQAALASNVAKLHNKTLSDVGKWHVLYRTEKGKEIMGRFLKS